MVTYAREHKNDTTRIGNSLRYAEKLPADYIALLLKQYEDIEEGYKETLMQIPEYHRIIQKRSTMRNGEVQ